MSDPTPEQLFLDNLGVIDEIVAYVAYRHRLNPDEHDELAAGVRLKLIENDYGVLRKFGGRSSLKTYLTVVITRYFLDRRIAQWGRWRPGVEARRNGPVAVLLEQLMVRDGLSFDEAVESLRNNHGVTESRAALEALMPSSVSPARRRFVGEEHLEGATAADDETTLAQRLDREADADKIGRALRAVLAECDPDDRLILKLRFQDGMQVVRIARLLNLEQRGLYRRLERIIKDLRGQMERLGVDAARVAAFLTDEPAKSSLVSVPIVKKRYGRAPAGPSADHA